MDSFADLWGRIRTALPKGRVLDERSELIKYFSQKLERPAKFIGVRLAHYSLSDLYALKSSFNDRLQRDGKETARKYWWWVTKTKTKV